MIKVGDTVVHTSDVSGVVVEIVDDTAYLERSNGTEVSFLIKQLVLSVPKKGESGFLDSNVWTQEQQEVLDRIPQNIMNALSGIYDAIPWRVTNFDNLPSRQKMNFICTVSKLSYKDIKEMENNDGLMSIVMAAGLVRFIDVRI